MGYVLELEEELLMLLPGLISGVPSGLFSLAAYVLTALAIYTISRRRGLSKPWLAWIPVVNCWLNYLKYHSCTVITPHLAI